MNDLVKSEEEIFDFLKEELREVDYGWGSEGYSTKSKDVSAVDFHKIMEKVKKRFRSLVRIVLINSRKEFKQEFIDKYQGNENVSFIDMLYFIDNKYM